jgi:hypothetical protein
MKILAGRVDLARCKNPVDKLSDTGFVVLGHETSDGEIWVYRLYPLEL